MRGLVLRALLVAGQPPRDGAVGAEDRDGVQLCHARPHPAGPGGPPAGLMEGPR